MSRNHDPKDRIEDFKTLKDLSNKLKDHVIKVARTYQMPKAKLQMSLAKIDDSVAIIHGRGGRTDPKKLKEEEIKRISILINDMHSEGKMFMMFMMSEDGSGLLDPISGKTFEFES